MHADAAICRDVCAMNDDDPYDNVTKGLSVDSSLCVGRIGGEVARNLEGSEIMLVRVVAERESRVIINSPGHNNPLLDPFVLSCYINEKSV